MSDQYQEIITNLSSSSKTGFDLRQECVTALDQLDGYDWSGIYRLEGETLVLDAYVGEPTEHDRIPVGIGVCGTAVATGEDQNIDDVTALDNYLSCSVSTKAELVVLIRDGDGEILGQIDIDSHQRGRFKAEDEALLRGLAEILARKW